MKKVIIRSDASTQIGSGHVMRCLTIARNLKRYGCEVLFWMEPLRGNLINYVKEQGFDNIQKAEQADLYIIDHYGIDEVWEREHRQYAKNIMVIDDLANRPHDCDLLLDQNVVPNYESRYDGLVPNHCIKLLGPKYLIMRDEFIEARQHLRKRTGEVKRLLLFMGGTDPTNEILKVLQALEKTSTFFEQIDVVVGNGNIHKEEIEQICRKRKIHYHCQIDYMAKLMQQADFSIGAGGLTTWERCYVGLPSSSTIVADNQFVTTEYAAELGAVWNLGWHEQVNVETYIQLLNSLPIKKEKILQLSEKGLLLTESNMPNAWINAILELLS